jgi:hypothetical protein
MIILQSKFRVTEISVFYITGENHIGSSFIRQKYFCLPTEVAVLPTEASNTISGGVTPYHDRFARKAAFHNLFIHATSGQCMTVNTFSHYKYKFYTLF